MEDFLRLVLPSGGYYFSITSIGGRKIHRAYTTIEDLARSIREGSDGGYDTYYAVAGYKEPFRWVEKNGKKKKQYRKKSDVKTIRVQHADIDVGPDKPYKTIAEARAALLEFLKQSKLPKPNIVESGRGLHIYWVMEEELLPSKWAFTTALFKQLAAELGFALDNARTSDESSILRPPGTLNYKEPHNPLPVRWVVRAPRMPYAVYSEILEAAAKEHGIKAKPRGAAKKSSVSDAIMGGLYKDMPPAKADVIADKCQQLSDCRAALGDVTEPLWYLMLGTLAFCEDGDNYAHSWSSGHAQYDASQTQNKLDQWRAAATGPARCEKWEHENPAACKGCSHKGRIGSPIRLGIVFEEAAPQEVQKTPDASEDAPLHVQVPYPFKRTTNGLVYMEDEDTPYQFLSYDLYVKDIVVNAEGGSEALIATKRPLEDWSTFTLPMVTFARKDKVRESFLDKRIILRSEKEAVMMTQYLNSYMESLQKAKRAVQGSHNFGWKDDGSFILGEYIIEPTGAASRNPALTAAIPLTRDIKMAGDVGTWVGVTEKLAEPDMAGHAFALLCGFAAPIFKFTGYGGAVVNLLGKTGVGKSTMLRMINSIWGDPEKLMLSAGDTDNSKLARMGYMNNLPVTIDEMGNTSGDRVSSLILKATQGMDVRRLRQDGTERQTRNWNTIVVMSANHSMSGKLNTFKFDVEAELMRLVEYNLHAPEHFQDKRNAKAFNETIKANYGKVGAIFAKRLTQIQGSLKARVDKAIDAIQLDNAGFSTKERYWEAVLATCYAAGELASGMGLIKFDYAKAVASVANQLFAQKEEKDMYKLTWVDMLNRYCNENLHKTLSVRYQDRSAPMVIREPRGEGVTIRIEQRMEKGKVSKAVMALHYYDLQRHLVSSFVDIVDFRRSVDADGALLGCNGRKSLGRGVDTTLVAPTRVLEIDLLAPALSKIWESYEYKSNDKVVDIDSRRNL